MKFTCTHRKNLNRHLKPVDRIYEQERLCELILEEASRHAQFLIDGFGPFTFDEAMSEVAICKIIFGHAAVITMLENTPPGK